MSRSAYLTDYPTTDDLLHFDFRPALLDIVQNAATPLTVGLFGPWGSGKTSLLRMLKRDLDDKGLPSLRTVWFTAWKYDQQDALWRAFILRVLDALYPRSGSGEWEERPRIPADKLGAEQQEQVAQLDRLAQSVYRPVEWSEVGRWAVEWSKTGKELAKLPAYLLLAAFGAGQSAKELGISPDLADLVQREAQTHHMEALRSMEQFEQRFQQALQLVYASRITPHVSRITHVAVSVPCGKMSFHKPKEGAENGCLGRKIKATTDRGADAAAGTTQPAGGG